MIDRREIDSLNSVQQKAVRHGDGPLLVLAGAGSGKTRVLTSRIAYLITECGVSPRRILAVTFTNKAAEEMKKRVAALVGGGNERAWIGTFHSICARILRTEADWGWWTRDFSIYDTSDQLDLIKTSMLRVGISATVLAPKAILSEISKAKDRLLTADGYAKRGGGRFEQAVSKIYAEYEKGLVKNNAFDFDDLIMQTVGLLRRNLDLKNSYSLRFLHVLVDEYQDTSHAQYELISMLSSHHQNICVVGDDDQSIYGWRGADITNILDFEKDHPDAVVLRLEQNYRSTGRILAAAHDVVSNNERRKEKKLWTEREHGAPVRLTRVSNEYQEADAIRDTVLMIMSGRPLAYRDFAVLYRTHAQSRVIEDSLRRAGIAYDIIGGVRFYERAEVKDVLAYLRVIINPADEVSLKRIINVPPRRAGEKSIERLEEFAEAEGIRVIDALARAGEVVGIPAAARDGMVSLEAMFARLRKTSDVTPVNELIDDLLNESGYVTWLEGRRSEESAQRLANLEELVSAASEFIELSGEGTLGAFLEQVALVANIDQWEDGANAVSLMTLHSAKGLEFTIVLIPGMEDGLLPHESAYDDDDEMEEERRLFYVGMTRAKDELHLFAADTRRRGSTMDLRSASRFLREIDPEHVEAVSVGPKARRGTGSFGQTQFGRRRAASPTSSRRSAGATPPRSGAAPPRGDVFPDYEGMSQERMELRVGARVRHAAWGEGIVLEIAGTSGDAIVRVRFGEGESGIEKRIMLRYGKLELVSD